MAKLQKLEYQVEVKFGAKYFQIFRSQAHLLPKICPKLIKDIKVLQGDWEAVGSIKQWSYVADDLEIIKEGVEAIDDENKSITFNAYGEAIEKYYKTFKSTIKVNGGIAKWTLEYETQSSDIPAPTKYLTVISIVSKAIDDYLSKN